MLIASKIYITLIPNRSYGSKILSCSFVKDDICHVFLFYFHFLRRSRKGQAFRYTCLPAGRSFSRTSKKDVAAIPNAPVCQIQFSLYFSFLPTILVQIVVNTTILIELKGINIAATTGASCPVTAK